MALDPQLPPVEFKAQWRSGMGALFGVLLILVVAGLTIPIDGGVAAEGQIAVEFQKKPVQHPSGGVLDRVLVQEGELVSTGQVVAVLTSADTAAESSMSELREFGLRVTQVRLLAEHGNERSIEYAESLLNTAKDRPEFQRILALERLNFDMRYRRYVAEREALQEGIQRLKIEVAAVHSTLVSRKRQLALLETDLGRRRSLMQSGFISEAGFSEFETKHAEVEAQVQKDIADKARIDRNLIESQSRLVQLQAERKTAASEKLAELNLELEMSTERRGAAGDKEERLKLRSPSDGRVVGILVHASGAVLTPGQTLMNVVPENEKRLIVARVPSHQIDGIVPGLPARIRISARSREAILDGRIETISADKTDDERNGGAYYTVRVGVDAGELAHSGLVSVEVGMPVQVMLTLERRTFFSYIVRPLQKFFNKALRE